MFRLYAELIAMHLDALEMLEQSQEDLTEQKRIASLRERFIAVLGHDLRNPVGVVKICAHILDELKLPEEAGTQVQQIQESTARMQEMIDNLLDLARFNLGAGIALHLESDNQNLVQGLEQVTEEVRAARGMSRVSLTHALDRAVPCDASRVGQLYSNLLNNAAEHGDPDAHIIAEIRTLDGEFQLSVSNKGPMIAKEEREQLFEPFTTRRSDDGYTGLGLGLYIASEIARAHGGEIRLHSDAEQTTFTFHMQIK